MNKDLRLLLAVITFVAFVGGGAALRFYILDSAAPVAIAWIEGSIGGVGIYMGLDFLLFRERPNGGLDESD